MANDYYVCLVPTSGFIDVVLRRRSSPNPLGVVRVKKVIVDGVEEKIDREKVVVFKHVFFKDDVAYIVTDKGGEKMVSYTRKRSRSSRKKK